MMTGAGLLVQTGCGCLFPGGLLCAQERERETRTWVAHRGVQQVHGSAAEPQAVDAVGGLFEVGHHATGGHCSTQLRPVVRFPPMLQLDGTGGRSKLLQARGTREKESVRNSVREKKINT